MFSLYGIILLYILKQYYPLYQVQTYSILVSQYGRALVTMPSAQATVLPSRWIQGSLSMRGSQVVVRKASEPQWATCSLYITNLSCKYIYVGKEQTHCSRYKMVYSSSLPNSSFFCSEIQTPFSSPFLISPYILDIDNLFLVH